MPPAAWRISNSAWRIGPDTTWLSETAHQQVYARPQLDKGAQLGMTLSEHQGKPLWIWLADDGQVAAMQDGAVVPCMGRISANTTVQAIELSLVRDGLTVKKGDAQMICPADSISATIPQIQTLHSTVELQSVGRDRRTDGKPLSPLWWMSGLMGLGFVWMLLFDSILAIVQRLRSFAAHDEE